MLSGALFDRCTPAIPSDDDGWVFFGDPDRVHVIRLTDDILWVRRAHLVAFTAVLACDTDPEPLIDEAVRLRPVRLSGTGSVAVMTATVPTVVTVHRTPTYVDLDTIVCWSGVTPSTPESDGEHTPRAAAGPVVELCGEGTVVVQSATEAAPTSHTHPSEHDHRQTPRPFGDLATFLGS